MQQAISTEMGFCFLTSGASAQGHTVRRALGTYWKVRLVQLKWGKVLCDPSATDLLGTSVTGTCVPPGQTLLCVGGCVGRQEYTSIGGGIA